jgi:hypothetical protein
MNCLRGGRIRSLYVPTYEKGDETDCSNYRAYPFCQLRTKFYPKSCCQDYLHMDMKLLGIISVDFDTTDQILIIYSAFVKYF